MEASENNIPAEIPESQAAAILEALLFSSEEPLAASRLREFAPELAAADIRKAVQALNQWYRESGRAFQVEEVAGGFQMFTLPQYAEYVERMYAKRQQNRLSPKALETLAIVAYKQPITRLEIEEIRGVNVDGVMKTLLSRNLITISGTASTPGNPFIYKTTRKFLEYFGLKSLKDLPRLKELDEIVEADSEIQEKFGEAFFKEIAPEILGMKENESVEDDENETVNQANDDNETSENDQNAEKQT